MHVQVGPTVLAPRPTVSTVDEEYHAGITARDFPRTWIRAQLRIAVSHVDVQGVTKGLVFGTDPIFDSDGVVQRVEVERKPAAEEKTGHAVVTG